MSAGFGDVGGGGFLVLALGGGACGCDEVSDSKPETFGCDSGGGCGDAFAGGDFSGTW